MVAGRRWQPSRNRGHRRPRLRTLSPGPAGASASSRQIMQDRRIDYRSFSLRVSTMISSVSKAFTSMAAQPAKTCRPDREQNRQNLPATPAKFPSGSRNRRLPFCCDCRCHSIKPPPSAPGILRRFTGFNLPRATKPVFRPNAKSYRQHSARKY